MFDDFVVETLNSLMEEKNGWAPAYCQYSETDSKFTFVFTCLLVLHGIVIVWQFFKGYFESIQKNLFSHPSTFIFLLIIIVAIVGERMINQ